MDTPEPGARRALGDTPSDTPLDTPHFRGHSRGHSGDTSGPKGPRDSCSRPAGSQIQNKISPFLVERPMTHPVSAGAFKEALSNSKFRQDKRNPNLNLFGPDIFQWRLGSLPLEGGGGQKIQTCLLKHKGNSTHCLAGCPGPLARISIDSRTKIETIMSNFRNLTSLNFGRKVEGAGSRRGHSSFWLYFRGKRYDSETANCP